MDQVSKSMRPRNPRIDANILSIITFGFTLPTFLKGYRKDLDGKDIPQVLEQHGASGLGNKLEDAWKLEQSSSNPSLWRALRRTFGTEFMVLGIGLLFIQICLRLMIPLSLVQLIKYFSRDEKESLSLYDSYLYGGLIVGASFFSVVFTQLVYVQLQSVAMQIRTACTALVYRKTLKLTQCALRKVTVGHITNLLSNDLHRFDDSVMSTHFIWIAPIEIVLTIYILYDQIGWAATIGILFMALLVPVQAFFGKLCCRLRLQTAIRTDERIRLMNEVISGMKVIKMYAWEKSFAKLIGNVRRLEAREIRAINYVRGYMKFVVITPKIGIFLAIATLLLTGYSVTAVFVFAATCFYENIKLSLTVHFIMGTLAVSELRISINRLREMLLEEEVGNDSRFQHTTVANQKLQKNEEPLVDLRQVSARWCKTAKEPTLNDVSLKVEGYQLSGIFGPVGSGKSSILHVILNELPIERGSIKIRGIVSYASQEPWIFTGNIQQNILFGQPMQIERYNEVLKACALEEDLSLLPYGDQSLVGERGVILSGGQRARVSLARAVYRNADIYLLDEPFSAIDTHVGKHIFDRCIKNFLREKTVILITYQMQYLSVFDTVYFLDDGKISSSSTYEHLSNLSSTFQYKSIYSNLLTYNDNYGKLQKIKEKKIQQLSAPESVEEQLHTGGVFKRVFLSYLRAGSSLPLCLLVGIVFILSQIALTSTDYFVAYWVNEQQKKSEHNNYTSYIPDEDFAYIYTGLVLVLTLSTLLRTYIFFLFFTRVSIGIHNNMFHNMVNTTMQFFHSHHSGMILNRFSKDMGIIDESIPTVISECLEVILTAIGSAIIVAIANPWLLISAPIVILMFCFLRAVYLPTGRNLSRLVGTARSPVFGHINESIQGLTTIRSSNSQLILQDEFDFHQDVHSSIWYLFVVCSRAFSFYSELVCVFYIAVITFSVLLNQTEQYSGNVGLVITQGIGLLGVLQWGMYQSCQLENQMTSVERVVEYAKLLPEDTREANQPNSSWPELGTIKFMSVFLSYGSKQESVLKNINFTVHSKEKIGIVGRTGAGKSSLITALFQLNSTGGVILIDNIDISQIPLHSLRSKISIIPQDPVLFSGTVRTNLDPFDEYTDEDIWTALEDVQLKSLVAGLTEALHYQVENGGSNFSVGQKQLICLSRAILRKNAILVLDEATANVDPETDNLIQNTIRKKFSGCTVLTIAHRLNTIMDCDKILIMDAGEVLEFEHPYLLLKNCNGVFYSMLQKTGTDMTKSLSKIAEDSYNLKMQITIEA